MGRSSDATKVARQNFAYWMTNEWVNQHLVYIDKAGFNLLTWRTRGRAVMGQRTVRQVAGNFVIAASPESDTVNMVKFNDFMYNVSLNFLDFEITFVVDNAAIHNQAHDCVEVIYF